MPLSGKILMTGGAGTLGRAIIKRATEEGWGCEISILSRDPMKHHRVKQMSPQVNCIAGDICDEEVLRNAMIGKDYVLHLAANKHIPESQKHSLDTIRVNIVGTINVASIALELGTPHVLCISTDKAAHPANAYGATKMLDESIFHEYARIASENGLRTQYHLVRYGNVLESTGSVIEVWKQQIERGERIKITNPAMTRFFISPSQAVDLVIGALQLESGMTLIPKMKSLSIGKLAEYTVGYGEGIGSFEKVPLRPGEKIHETLLTLEECEYAVETDDYFFLNPSTGQKSNYPVEGPYSSDIAEELTKDELTRLLEG